MDNLRFHMIGALEIITWLCLNFIDWRDANNHVHIEVQSSGMNCLAISVILNLCHYSRVKWGPFILVHIILSQYSFISSKLVCMYIYIFFLMYDSQSFLICQLKNVLIVSLSFGKQIALLLDFWEVALTPAQLMNV